MEGSFLVERHIGGDQTTEIHAPQRVLEAAQTQPLYAERAAVFLNAFVARKRRLPYSVSQIPILDKPSQYSTETLQRKNLLVLYESGNPDFIAYLSPQALQLLEQADSLENLAANINQFVAKRNNLPLYTQSFERTLANQFHSALTLKEKELRALLSGAALQLIDQRGYRILCSLEEFAELINQFYQNHKRIPIAKGKWDRTREGLLGTQFLKELSSSEFKALLLSEVMIQARDLKLSKETPVEVAAELSRLVKENGRLPTSNLNAPDELQLVAKFRKWIQFDDFLGNLSQEPWKLLLIRREVKAPYRRLPQQDRVLLSQSML